MPRRAPLPIAALIAAVDTRAAKRLLPTGAYTLGTQLGLLYAIMSLLVMGIAGGAIIPQLFAVLKQHIDFQLVFVLLMVPCYLYILFYSVIGHRAGLPQDKA